MTQRNLADRNVAVSSSAGMANETAGPADASPDAPSRRVGPLPDPEYRLWRDFMDAYGAVED